MDVSEAIKRLRATQPQNVNTMLVCDELEKLRKGVVPHSQDQLDPQRHKTKPQPLEAGAPRPICEGRRMKRTLAQRNRRARKGEQKEWFRCPTCIFHHPFEVTDERPCPNLNLST